MTPELRLRYEMMADLEVLLEPLRHATGDQRLGCNLLELVKLESVPGAPAQISEQILNLAQHIRRIDERTNSDIQWLLAERKRTMAEFSPDYRPLVMYAIYRADLEMPEEKLAPICGHAYVDSHDNARLLRPDVTAQYKGTGHGTKLCMYAKNEGQLLRAYRDVQNLGLPHALVIDRGDVLPPHFDGNPVVTALGIGPVYKDEVAHITKRYSMKKHR